MDIQERMNLVCLLAKELSQSITAYAEAKEQKNGTNYYGYGLKQPECKSSIERKIITMREQLNEIRQDL